MIISPWMTEVIAREFGDPRYAALGESIARLDESIFDNQDLDRMVGAILILVNRGLAIEDIDRATFDWRDLLMGAGLANDDWAAVIADRFGTQSSP